MQLAPALGGVEAAAVSSAAATTSTPLALTLPLQSLAGDVTEVQAGGGVVDLALRRHQEGRRSDTRATVPAHRLGAQRHAEHPIHGQGNHDLARPAIVRKPVVYGVRYALSFGVRN